MAMNVMVRKAQQGFTLIELMIVVAIIGILAAVAIPQYQDYVTRSKLSKAATAVDPIKTAVAMYAQENGGIPAAALSWASLGLAAPVVSASNSSASAIAMGANGAIVLTLDGVGTSPAYNGSTVTFTPQVNSTNVTWGAACSLGANANLTKIFGC
ncbi:pilin [Thiobacillus sp.]|uniref:pilin n=1 Tax=Thiobacillus sp. TaxID=924 RepID=UPI0025DAE478|nr:pilin [Thiobacillus sp.]